MGFEFGQKRQKKLIKGDTKNQTLFPLRALFFNVIMKLISQVLLDYKDYVNTKISDLVNPALCFLGMFRYYQL